MNFKTRQVGHYMNLEIEIDNAKFDLGLQDQIEIRAIILELQEAIEDFRKYLDDDIS